MKKIAVLISLLMSFTGLVKAQITLTAETHALRAGDVHITQKAQYVDAGKEGKNVIWDFSSLKCLGTEITPLETAASAEKSDLVPQANISTTDDGTTFFFRSSNAGNESVGMSTANSIIIYDQPILRTQFPFTYGDTFEQKFNGEGHYGSVMPTYISGTIKGHADAYGTLILPNGIEKDVLRIKVVTNTLEIAYCNYTETENIKYLWYSKDSRYPLLVTMKTTTKPSNQAEKISEWSNYTDKVYSSKKKSESLIQDFVNIEYTYKTYPNPYKSSFNIEYNLPKEVKVSIELFEVEGKKVCSIVDNQLQSEGVHTCTFESSKVSLKAGIYFVKFTFGDKIYLEKVVQQE